MVMGNDLLSTLKEQAAYQEYYDSLEPVACPHDGTPLLQGPAEQPGILYCPNGDFQYPRDWNVRTMSGM
jgi:hypothetical protein